MTRDELEAIRVQDARHPDCGDNSCQFIPQRGGMRTNGGCRCWGRRDPSGDPRAVPFAARAIRDRRDLLAYADRLLAVVAAADAWLVKDDEVEDDPLTVKSREAYRTARKTLEGKT